MFEIKGTEKLDYEEKLDYIYDFTKSQLKSEDDKIALMSNISAIIMALFKDINWVGFYLVKNNELVLGPFQGLPACTRLKKDTGVCAKSWRDKSPVRVDDVHEFPGHVACDSASNSELVIPLISNEEVFGVLDIDSPLKSRFSKDDEEFFLKLVNLFESHLI